MPYTKTTNASRRQADENKAQALMASLADTDPRKPGYVSKSPRNMMRDAGRTKGADYSRCSIVHFELAQPSIGKPGFVIMQNKARSDKPLHRVLARKVAQLIPDVLKPSMGLLPTVDA